MTDSEYDRRRRVSALSRRRLLAAVGTTSLAGVTGCLDVSVNEDESGDPLPIDPVTSTTTAPTSDQTAPTATTPTSIDCGSRDSIPWTLRVGFRPTLETDNAQKVNICVDWIHWWVAGEDEPGTLQAPADGSGNCFDVPKNTSSPPVWEHWGISPCAYESLGVTFLGASLKYSDGHSDHDFHKQSMPTDTVWWDLGQSGGSVQVDSDDEFDITAYLDVSRTEDDSDYEFTLAAGGLSGS